MPYPNEHSCRVEQPLPNNLGIFARKSVAPGVSIILQKPKSGNGSAMRAQAYRFSKNQYTAQEAKDWLKSHKISCISFEPAMSSNKKEALANITKILSDHIIEGRGAGQGVGNPRQGDGGTDTCVCPSCKEEVTHDRGTPCNEVKCPKCGAMMVGK